MFSETSVLGISTNPQQNAVATSSLSKAKGPGNELEILMASRANRWASEIIPDQLWLGSGSDAENFEALESRNIKHILNVADDVPNFHNHTIIYLNLGVKDFGEDRGISRVFEAAFAFLQAAQDNSEPVLVHCAAGANRSATVVMAWLMHSRQWSLVDTWKYIKGKRRGVVPLKDNRLELLNFERKIHGKSSFASDDDFLRLR